MIDPHHDQKITLSGQFKTALDAANSAAMDLFVTAAKAGDPLATVLLGMDEKTLSIIAQATRREIKAMTSSLSIPVFRLRFPKPEVMQALLSNGCKDPLVQRELLREMPFELIETQRR